MSDVTVQPVNWFLWVGFCSLGHFLCTERGTTNNITKRHTQFCFFVITHNTLLAMEISGSLQGPGYQVLLFHLLMQTAPEQKRMLGGVKKAVRLFLPLSQTSNIIYDDSWRPCMTPLDRNPAVCRDMHVHGWGFHSSPHEILQGCGTLWSKSPW